MKTITGGFGALLQHPISRRALLLGLSAETLLALQHAHRAVQSGDTKLTYFDPATAAEIEAIASTIIPSDGTPGAKEAGVLFFIDRALATFDQEQRELYRTGLDQARRKARELFPGVTPLAALSSVQREALLTAIETTPFFEAIRTHVIIGFLANPAWGGNRDKAGWKVIGFDDAGIYQPPFGYYDTPGAEP